MVDERDLICREYGEVVLCLIGPRDSLSKLDDKFGLTGSVEALGIRGLGPIALISGMSMVKLLRRLDATSISPLFCVKGRVSEGISSIASSEDVASVSGEGMIA